MKQLEELGIIELLLRNVIYMNISERNLTYMTKLIFVINNQLEFFKDKPQLAQRVFQKSIQSLIMVLTIGDFENTEEIKQVKMEIIRIMKYIYEQHR